MFKQVAAFKTSDNRIHDTRLQALLAEQKLELRSIMVQAGVNGLPLKSETLTLSDAIQLFINNIDKLANETRRYNKMIRNERAKGQKAVKVS